MRSQCVPSPFSGPGDEASARVARENILGWPRPLILSPDRG